MGLMDRDYYREKPKEGIVDKLKRNLIVVIAITLLLIFLIAYVI